MKKAFWIGFVVGLVYFAATYLFEVVIMGCPWGMNEGMCGLGIAFANLPSMFLLQLLPPNVALGGMILLPAITALLFGLVFLYIKKLQLYIKKLHALSDAENENLSAQNISEKYKVVNAWGFYAVSVFIGAIFAVILGMYLGTDVTIENELWKMLFILSGGLSLISFILFIVSIIKKQRKNSVMYLINIFSLPAITIIIAFFGAMTLMNILNL